MMKTTFGRMFAIMLLSAAGLTAVAQKTMSVNQYRRASYDKQVKYNPYSVNSQPKSNSSFGVFYAEYNPHYWNTSGSDTPKNTDLYHGISLGFSYFVPFSSPLGIDAGLKMQYLFRSETVTGVKNRFGMLAATLPVSLAYDLHVSDGFIIHPYAGLYGRYTFNAKTEQEAGDRRYTLDWMKSDHPNGGMKRLQTGWQAGVSFRVSEVFFFGGGYWMDFGKVTDYDQLHGFNVMLGATF